MTRLLQVPVVLVPIDFNSSAARSREGFRSIVIRTFITADFMTGVPAIPMDVATEREGDSNEDTTTIARLPPNCIPFVALQEMVDGVLSVKNGEKDNRVSRVLYDCTAKPPGTTEWE